MRRAFVFLMTITVLLCNINFIAKAKEPEPVVSADSAVLMDAETGTILYSKNMNVAYPPASTTKTMTALLTLENTNLDDKVKVSKNVPYVDGSKIGLFEDEEITVKDLLYGLLLLSGNDCAEALAEHVGGSLDNFAQLMNKRAKELGCENTSFVNPSGLYNENHKTSAKDLALIMREVVKHPEFREIATTYSYKIPATNKHPDGIPLGNEDKLVNKNSKYYYAGAEAGKTGYTVQSQHSFVASATKNGQRLIVALVHDKNKTFFEDTKSLFDYGFNNYKLETLFKKGDQVSAIDEDGVNVPLVAAADYFYVKEKDSANKPQYALVNKDLKDLKDLSFKKGDILTEATVNFNDKTLPSLKLASGIDHEKKTLLGNDLTPETKKDNKLVLSSAAFILLLGFGGFLKMNQRKRRLYRNK